VCAKLGDAVGPVEAGLRSYDRTMPEEINRMVTDQLSTLVFTRQSTATRTSCAREFLDVDVVIVGRPDSRSSVQITLHDVPVQLGGLEVR
jgi:UDP-N-acetylglucosamine 2-epimerase